MDTVVIWSFVLVLWSEHATKPTANAHLKIVCLLKIIVSSSHTEQTNGLDALSPPGADFYIGPSLRVVHDSCTTAKATGRSELGGRIGPADRQDTRAESRVEDPR